MFNYEKMEEEIKNDHVKGEYYDLLDILRPRKIYEEEAEDMTPEDLKEHLNKMEVIENYKGD